VFGNWENRETTINIVRIKTEIIIPHIKSSETRFID